MKYEVYKSSGNLYADLGHSQPEAKEAKAALAREIYHIIKKRKLTQAEAAQILGIPQSTLSRLLRGQISGFSAERLMRLLLSLGQDVSISIKPSRKRQATGCLSVHTPSSPPIAARSAFTR
jgi:predicted XRE-type DNA-binding protein